MKNISKIILAIFLTIASGNKSNALDIVELKKPVSNKVVIKLMFRNGSVCDAAGRDGLTLLTANLLTEGGTAKHSHADLQKMMYPWAARISVSVDKEVSVFTFEVPKEFLTQFYEEVVKGLFLSPAFSKEDFERVKSNQQNYVDEVIRSSSDEDYSKVALEDFLFNGTCYAHPVQGTSAGVQAITLEDVISHYKAFFTSANLTIGIAGSYPDVFPNQITKDFSQLSSAAPAIPAIPKPKMPDGINVEIISKENALGSAVFTGFPIDITRANDDFAALMVANSWLGEHRKSYSRLYQKIREARSMNYGDYSYIEWYPGGGGNMLPPSGYPRSSNYFSIWLRPVQTAKGLKMQYPELKDILVGHAQFAIRMALRETDNLVKNGMTSADFILTRDFLRSYMKLYIQTPAAQLGYLMDSKFYGRKDYISEMDALLAKLTLEDVNKAIKKYFQVNNMCISIVTDQSEAYPLMQALKANTPSPMSYSDVLKSALPQTILDEDKQVEGFPMNVKNVTIVNSSDTFRK